MEYIEIWKQIIGYEGIYSISNFGRVRRDCGGCGASAGYILKNVKDNRGYYQVVLSKNNVKKTHKTYNLVALHFIGIKEKGMAVNHIDGNKKNNCIWNLEYVTCLENNHHAMSLGLWDCFGEKNKSSKLKNEDILKIRNSYKNENVSISTLSKEYNVHFTTINRIVKNRTWKNLNIG